MKGTLFKKLVAGALALLMVGTALPQGSYLTGIFGGSEITASAETVGGTCGKNANWSFDTETGKLTITGTGLMNSAPWRDSYKDEITSVEIENGITNIYDKAFNNCSRLASVTIPNGVKGIGKIAFDSCISLASVTIPGTVEKIGMNAFKNCDALEKVTIQEGVKEFGEKAFYSCGRLASVTIPGTVETIGEEAFSLCESLKQVTIPQSVNVISSKAFKLCKALEKVTISKGVQEIGEEAFSGCKVLKQITFPKTVKTIGYCAFDSCTALEQVTIPGTVETIGWGAFQRCSALEKVTIQNGVKKIGEKAFGTCGKLKQVTIPGSIDNIDGYAFDLSNNLEQVNILEGSRTVSADVLSAFPYCEKLSSVVVPSSVTEIEANALRNIENLKAVYMLCDPANLTWDFPEEKYIRYSSEEGKKVDVYVPYMYKQGYLNKFKSVFLSLSDADFLGAYNVSVSGLVTNGSVVADRFMAAQGETVHFTVTPNTSCIVKHVAVNGNEVANNSDGTYSFVMPAEDVSILAIIDRFNAAHLYGHSISLDGDIGVNFYMELDQSILSSQTAYMQFDVPDGKKTETQIVYVKDVLDDPVTISGRTYFKFKCRVAAKDMAAEIVAQLHDGNARGEEYKYSVREYAKYILDHYDNYNEKTINLVKAMLNYGSAAQEYFLNESGSDLANFDLDTDYNKVDDVTAETINKPYNATVTKLPEEISFEGVTLSLRSKTTLSFYFKSDIDLSTVLGDDYPIETTPDGYQVYRIRGISAEKLDNDFAIDKADADCCLSYSPLTYCYNVLNRKSGSDALQKVCKALFLYNQAANDYFDKAEA